MKLLSLGLAASALMLAGCDSVSDMAESVHTTLAPREEAHERTYPQGQRAVYEAAIKVLADMDFHQTHGGPAQGLIEALNGVATGDGAGSSRQISLKATLEPAVEGGTHVVVSLHEIYESDSSRQPGLATDTPLRDSPMGEIFLRGIEEHLARADR